MHKDYLFLDSKLEKKNVPSDEGKFLEVKRVICIKSTLLKY